LLACDDERSGEGARDVRAVVAVELARREGLGEARAVGDSGEKTSRAGDRISGQE